MELATFSQRGWRRLLSAKLEPLPDRKDLQIAPFEKVTAETKELLQNAVQATVLLRFEIQVRLYFW